MQPKSATMLRILLNRYVRGSPETFLACLPAEDVKDVLSCNVSVADPALLVGNPLGKVNAIHYSWFLPLFQKLYKDGQQVLLSMMPEHHAAKLSQILKVKPLEGTMLPFVKEFLADVLLKKITGAGKVLPKECLPNSILNPLIDWNKNELVEIIDCLGVHDLAVELRSVVDQKILRSVYACLSPREQQYLKMCMHLKDKLATPPLGLDRWGGNCETLKAALRMRGLLRFGKALSGEHPDFIWHVAHILDTGRGQTLIKYYEKQPIAGITPTLAQQVQNLMNMIKKVG